MQGALRQAVTNDMGDWGRLMDRVHQLGLIEYGHKNLKASAGLLVLFGLQKRIKNHKNL